MNIKYKGFVLINVLILFLVLLIISAAATIITKMGYFSISSEAKYQIAEKNANKALLQVITELYNGSQICNGTKNYSFSLGNAQIKLVADENGKSCFIWSQGNYKNAKVVKTAVVSGFNYGATIIKYLNYFSIKGSGAIVSCEDSCRIPAMVIGNEYEGLTGTTLEICPNNPKGVLALVYPVKQKVNFNPYALAFNDIDNRDELLETLESSFGVEFDNGTPISVKGNNVWTPPPGLVISKCEGKNGNQIECSTESENTIIFTYDNSKFSCNLDNLNYDALDLGNVSLTIDNLNIPAKIAAGTIKFNNKATLSQTTLVAKDIIKIDKGANNISISNAKLFAKNYKFEGNNINLEAGIIYGGGTGIANFDIQSTTNIGSLENPTLIILDNIDVTIGHAGTAEIHGLIFTTEGNNELNIDAEGRFELYGILISGSLKTNIDITGNFGTFFDKNAVDTLAQNFDFVHPAICGPLNLYLILSKLRAY